MINPSHKINEKLFPHFIWREMQCKNGLYPPEDMRHSINDTLEFVECLRFLMNAVIWERTQKWIDAGIRVVSAYRPVNYEKAHKRSGNSRHTQFQALDICPTVGYRYFTYNEFWKMAELIDNNFKGRAYRLGSYAKTFDHYRNITWIHVDCAYGYGGRRWYN